MNIGDTYKHFKGNTYTILNLARDSETTEEVVVYQGLHTCPKFGDKPIWIRSKKEFEKKIEFQGKLIQRFTKVNT
ncbi:MAG: hypothetical protein ACI8Y7_000815 [Candidatus Woesearchaeota archaeon]|jgi:hypothetical protein